MKISRRAALAITFAALALALSARVLFPSILHGSRVLWFGSEGLSYIDYSFKYFDGVKERLIYINGGPLIVDYDAKLSKGVVVIEVQGINGTVLHSKEIKSSERGSIEINTGGAGWYKIRIIGKGAEGSLRVSWRTLGER